jgi:hypothetical protein
VNTGGQFLLQDPTPEHEVEKDIAGRKKSVFLKKYSLSTLESFSQGRKACMRRGEERVEKSKWK